MKKSIFILATLFAATIANAQITLEHTIDGEIEELPFSAREKFTLGDIFIHHINGNMYVIDAHTYDAIIVPSEVANMGLWCVAKGYFTADSRICFIVSNGDKTTNETHQILIYDENGTMIQDLGSCNQEGVTPFQLRNGEYKLCIRKKIGENDQTEIYSLPGNGDTSDDVVTPSAQRCNARKYLQNDQVLIDNNEQTFNVQGARVR